MNSTELELQTLKYPIGNFKVPEAYSNTLISECKQTIAGFADVIQDKVKGLTHEQLNWKYRPNGWTVKQVVHHCADSHMNAFIRFKWTLTENKPLIKPYHEASWAELPDSLEGDVEDSLTILKGLHRRFAVLLNNLDQDDLEKTFVHPDWDDPLSLNMTLCLYAWHCKHHLAHIDNALKSKGIYNNQ